MEISPGAFPVVLCAALLMVCLTSRSAAAH
jgi:hypothetical protein